jgi:glycosyltransferase involved in cell wall biosynthesis
VGGTPEIVEDGVSGLLVPPKDPQAMAGAIACLLGNPGLREALVQAAQERARTQFSFARLLSELDHLYATPRRGRKQIGYPGTPVAQGWNS